VEIGQEFKAEFQISEAIHKGFTNVFNDRNPMHIDDSYAQSKGYKGKIMQGNILNGFLSYFIGETLPVKNVIIISQEISFRQAFFIGDALTLVARIKDVHELYEVYDFKYNFSNQQGNKIATGKISIKSI